MLQVRQPLEPLRQVPVPVAEQLHARRQEDRPDDGRVDQDRRGEPDPELLEDHRLKGAEDGEHADHHDRRARHDPRRGLDPVRHRRLRVHAAVVALTDPAEDEDVVVHRQPEEDHEEEDREERVDPAGELEAEEPLAPAVLEDEDEDSVRRPDREHVQDHRLGCDHNRAERDEHQQEREQQDEAEHERPCGLQLVVEVHGLRRGAGHAVLGSFERADRRRDDFLPERRQSLFRGRVRPVALDGDRDVRDGLGRVNVDVDRLVHDAAVNRAPLELTDRLLNRGGLDVRRLDDDARSDLGAGESHLEAVVGPEEVLRVGVDAGVGCLQLVGRYCEGHEQTAGQHDRDNWTLEDPVDDRAPDPPLAVVTAQAVDEWDPPAVDVVAELREQGRQHRERTEQRDSDDGHGRHREGDERRVAGEEHARHGDEHRHARDKHRAAGRRCSSLERRLFSPTGSAFLALSLQVEHRVVDAHCQADQEDDRADRVGHRQQKADECDEAHRPEHCGQSQEQRDARRDERTERDDEDDQRQGNREHPGLREVLLEGFVEVLAGALAEGSDVEVRMRGLHLFHAIEDRVDLVDRLVRLAPNLHRDEDRVLVVRDQTAALGGVERRLDLRDRIQAPDAGDDVLHRCPELRIRRQQLGVLNEHALTARLLEILVEDGVGSPGFPGARGLEDDHLLCEHEVAEHEEHGHRREPAEDRNLAVIGTPARHARCEMVFPRCGQERYLLLVHGARMGWASGTRARARLTSSQAMPRPKSVMPIGPVGKGWAMAKIAAPIAISNVGPRPPIGLTAMAAARAMTNQDRSDAMKRAMPT